LGICRWPEPSTKATPTGAVLIDRHIGFLTGLRLRDAIAGQPSLAGFVMFSIGVDSIDTLGEVARRCGQLDIAHGDLIDRGPDGTQLDVPDPHATVIRFLSPFADDGLSSPGGVQPRRRPRFYTTPRLTP